MISVKRSILLISLAILSVQCVEKQSDGTGVKTDKHEQVESKKAEVVTPVGANMKTQDSDPSNNLDMKSGSDAKAGGRDIKTDSGEETAGELSETEGQAFLEASHAWKVHGVEVVADPDIESQSLIDALSVAKAAAGRADIVARMKELQMKEVLIGSEYFTYTNLEGDIDGVSWEAGSSADDFPVFLRAQSVDGSVATRAWRAHDIDLLIPTNTEAALIKATLLAVTAAANRQDLLAEMTRLKIQSLLISEQNSIQTSNGGMMLSWKRDYAADKMLHFLRSLTAADDLSAAPRTIPTDDTSYDDAMTKALIEANTTWSISHRVEIVRESNLGKKDSLAQLNLLNAAAANEEIVAELKRLGINKVQISSGQFQYESSGKLTVTWKVGHSSLQFLEFLKSL